MRCCLTMILLLANVATHAAEVSATIADGKLGARIDAIAYPASLPKELTSGLTNRLYVRVTLLDAKQPAGQRSVEIAIRYDLWDQKYSVVCMLEGAVTDTRVLANADELNALLGALPLPGLFDAATLPGAHTLMLRVEVLLNPIDREKMRMIRKWVAQNSAPEMGAEQGISVSNAIFNRIFDQYADGTNIAARWRVAVDSPPFRLDGLKHEGR